MEDSYIVIKIKDNGTGIPTEIQSRIYDPFFTTKEMGKGTGLGLDVVSRIVYGHNGSIEIGAFAEKINTGERNLYSIFKRKDISTDMLAKISEVLKFDFFSFYKPQTASSWSEPEGAYLLNKKKITMTLTISGEAEKYRTNFTEFLNAVINEAAVHGFTLK